LPSIESNLIRLNKIGENHEKSKSPSERKSDSSGTHRKGKIGRRADIDILLNGKALEAFDDWIEHCMNPFKSDTPVFMGLRWQINQDALWSGGIMSGGKNPHQQSRGVHG